MKPSSENNDHQKLSDYAAEKVQRLNELQSLIMSIKDDTHKALLQSSLNRLCILEAQELTRVRSLLIEVKENLDNLRLAIVSQEFDLFATKQERDKLRQQFGDQNP